MKFSDLFVVVALVSGLFGLIVAIARQKHFLLNAVNPYRRSWLLAGMSILWVGIGLLHFETKSWDVREWATLLSPMVDERPMPFKVKMASVAILAGTLFLLILLFCVISMPRDPSAFRRPEDRKRAFRYYVTKLKIGLDYAVLMRNDGEIVEEAWCAKQIDRYIDHLPRLEGRTRTLAEQVAAWRATAVSIHRGMPQLDAITAPANQGPNRRLVFDIDYGGMFFIYLHLPDPRVPEGDHVYLFGATLSQSQMNSRTADQHFTMMVEAMRNIEDSIRGA